MARKRKITPRSKEYIKEAVDIIENSEDDDAALEFLKDTLIDEFPDLDLGSMDLHEAAKVLEEPDLGKKRKPTRGPVEDLNHALGEFIKKQDMKREKIRNKKRVNARKRKARKKKKKK